MASHSDVDPARVRMIWAVMAILAVVLAGIWAPRLLAGEEPEPALVAVPTAVSTEPSLMPSPAPALTPTPSTTAVRTPTGSPTGGTPVPTPMPSVGPGETVLFRGGPAQGPWQQLGTVAEITHPEAPPTARHFYTNFWSDPEQENQSDELWDRLVRPVTAQLVELGDPVDRPAFGAAEGSEPFNSAGGMEDVYFSDKVFTAYWSGVFENESGVGDAHYFYLLSFDGEVLDSTGPVIYWEDGERGFEDNVQEATADLRQWAGERGYTGCERC